MIAQFSNKQEITIPVREGMLAAADGSNRRAQLPAGSDGRVLLVTVTDVQFPVTLEVIYQVSTDLESIRYDLILESLFS